MTVVNYIDEFVAHIEKLNEDPAFAARLGNELSDRLPNTTIFGRPAGLLPEYTESYPVDRDILPDHIVKNYHDYNK